jgi:hypothetical protein
MIDSFGRISGDTEGLLSERWIPEVNSYGLYCPSATAAAKKESEGYQMASPSNNDFPSNSHCPAVVEAPDFIPKAEGYFLDCVTRYFGKEYNSVKKALQALHGELRTCLEQLSEFAGDPDAADKVGVLLEKYRAKYGLDLNKIPDHLVKEMVRLSKQEKAIKALLFEQHKQYEKNKKMQEWLEDITREWRDHKENEPWYLKVFGSLLKPIQEKRDIYFFKAHGNDRVTSENLESTLQWLQRQPVETTKALNTIELRMKELNDELSYCKNQLASVKEDSLDVEKAMVRMGCLKRKRCSGKIRHRGSLQSLPFCHALLGGQVAAGDKGYAKTGRQTNLFKREDQEKVAPIFNAYTLHRVNALCNPKALFVFYL